MPATVRHMKTLPTLVFTTFSVVAYCQVYSTIHIDAHLQTRLAENTLADTQHLRETVYAEDVPADKALAERLKPITANTKRIDTTRRWTRIVSKELWNTTEGGEAEYYYQGDELEKIVARRYGETGQQVTEYYILSGQLSFVRETIKEYNRPVYYDSSAMTENTDTEAFDTAQTRVVERRSYLIDGKMIYHSDGQHRSSPLATDYILQEQRRINAEYEELVKPRARK